jgi:hypothetical protein
MVALSTAKAVRIAPGQRLVLNLASATAGKADASLEVQSDRPVAVGQWIASVTPLEIMTISDFPVLGSESLPANVFTPDQAVAASAGSLSDDTIPDVTTTTVAVSTTTVAGASTTTVAGATTTTIRLPWNGY